MGKADDIFKSIESMNEDAGTLSEGSLSMVSDWIDTGSYALNAICSGSLYKGVPKGRIIGFAGPSGCGKSYIMNKVAAKFQRQSPEHWVEIWDTEAAVEKDAFKNVGGDPSRVKVFPVETVESCRNQIVKFLNNVIDAGEKHVGKHMIIIDSLGNLASQKEVDDTGKDKHAADMGLRAKTLKSMMRTLTYRAAKAGVTILFSNHTYDDPTAMYDKVVKNQSGGKGPVYLASLLVQLSVTQEKGEKNEGVTLALARKINSVNMRALTVKNRFIPAFLETELHLNFVDGLSKYGGLIEMLTAYGVVEQNGATYTLREDLAKVYGKEKLGYYKVWSKDEALWEILLPELDKELQNALAYNNEADDNELEEDDTDEEA